MLNRPQTGRVMNFNLERRVNVQSHLRQYDILWFEVCNTDYNLVHVDDSWHLKTWTERIFIQDSNWHTCSVCVCLFVHVDRLSTRFCDMAAGSCSHLDTSCEVQHWCWVIRPGSQSMFQFIPKVLDGVKVRALCRPVMFFQTKLGKPFLHGATRTSSCWNRKGTNTNCWYKAGRTLFMFVQKVILCCSIKGNSIGFRKKSGGVEFARPGYISC